MQSVEYTPEHGATMVEATIAIAILFLFLGAIIDFGFALYQYNFLNYTTTRAGREISTKLALSKNCGVIEQHLTSVAYREMTEAIKSTGNVRWTWSTQVRARAPGGDLQDLVLVGKLPLNCYFICNVVPKDWGITVTISSTIESPLDGSCSGGPVP